MGTVVHHSIFLVGVERSGIGKDEIFCGDYVDMVRSASSKLFSDMSRSASGVTCSSQLSPKTSRRNSYQSGCTLLSCLFTGSMQFASLRFVCKAEWTDGKVKKMKR